MDEKNNDRIRVMEILNRSQYNDEIIDGLDMSNLDLTFFRFVRGDGRGYHGKTSPFKSFFTNESIFF